MRNFHFLIIRSGNSKSIRKRRQRSQPQYAPSGSRPPHSGTWCCCPGAPATSQYTPLPCRSEPSCEGRKKASFPFFFFLSLFSFRLLSFFLTFLLSFLLSALLFFFLYFFLLLFLLGWREGVCSGGASALAISQCTPLPCRSVHSCEGKKASFPLV